MRIGVVTRGQVQDLDWAQRLGFRSMEWMGFHDGPAGPTGNGSDHALRVLIVDDDAQQRGLIGTLLEEAGLKVVEVSTRQRTRDRPDCCGDASAKLYGWRATCHLCPAVAVDQNGRHFG